MELEKRLSAIIGQAEGTWGVVVEEQGSAKGTRFEHVPDELFIAESVIKVPIMAGVFAASEQGHFRLDDQLVLRQEDLVGGSGILYALSPGLRLTIRDLVTLMIIQSDNTATNMLIDLVGKDQIDQTMIDLGMHQSCYSRKLMIYPLDITDNNKITAGDVANMLGHLATGSYLSQHACKEMIAIMKKQQVRNGLPSQLPNEEEPNYPGWELPCKSGWDTGRQHDVGLLYTNNRCFSITALSKDVTAQSALNTLGLLGRAVYDYAILAVDN
ncbi:MULTISPECIES: serine hydrolase [unclassified Brevibacillus]|uniref:serine hydrolase n=1 Tax=unclassified Brevibacillus TaxID=2684853 RepID=UPI00356B3950